MKNISIYLMVLLLFFVASSLLAQNNAIFAGGNDDGFAFASSRTNNAIFAGGDDDGFATATSRTNNAIFGGGDDDGFAFARSSTNNAIFSGGDDDGFATASTEIWQFSPIDVRVYLQGPFNGMGMNDQLRYLSDFPMQEPYSAMGYTLQNEACRIEEDVLSDNRIVDWVLVQLRTSETEVAATKAALLQYNGDVVDIDGQSYVRFVNLPQREYYIAVMHRNHLGTMTDRLVFVAAE